MIKDGALGLMVDLGKPNNILALPRRGPSWARASMVHLLVCPKTSRSLSSKHNWLSFGGLPVNLIILHHERVLVIRYVLRSVATWAI
jgi:hypothetical protein